MEPIKAYWKVDHTCCMNLHNIKFNLDKPEDYKQEGKGLEYDPEDTDCKSVEEMIGCLETIEQAINDLEWLKEHISLSWINGMSAEDQIKLLRILGVEITCKN